MSVGYEESYWPTLGLLADMQFNLTEQISKEMHVKLRALHTDHEMYGFVKSVPLVQENLKQCSDFLRSEVKDERVAKKYRIKGNHHFAKNRMKEALNMYNACILHAPFLEKDIAEGNSASPEDVKGTSELALGFANRSAVLLNKKEYEACINDIQRALALDYPVKSRYKLYERYAKCLIHQEKFSEAELIVHEGLIFLEKSDLREDQKFRIKKSLTNIEALCLRHPNISANYVKKLMTVVSTISAISSTEEQKRFAEKLLINVLQPALRNPKDFTWTEINKKVREGFDKMKSEFKLKDKEKSIIDQAMADLETPTEMLTESQLKPKKEDAYQKVHIETNSASNYPNLAISCEVRKTTEKGHHVVAKNDLKPGDAIIVEKPYAHAILQQFKYMYCHHCLVFTLAPIPCKRCNSALFCSEECRDIAHSYHQYECHCIKELLHETITEMKYLHLALRIMTITGLSTLLKHRKFLNGEVIDGKQQQLTAYDILYQKPTHTGDQTGEELFEKCVAALFLVQCLEQGGFFNDADERDNVKDYVGGLLFHHLQSLKISSVAVFEVEVLNPSAEVMWKNTTTIAYAAYPTVSLLNHSCDPLVCLTDTDEGCVVRALSTIKAGEEVCMSYGLAYIGDSLETRQNWARKIYKFRCACIACKENWPMENVLKGRDPSWKCQSCGAALGTRPAGSLCSVKCLSCKSVNNIERVASSLNQSTTELLNVAPSMLWRNKKPKEAVNLLLEYKSVLEKLICKPSNYHIQCEIELRNCYQLIGKHHLYEPESN